MKFLICVKNYSLVKNDVAQYDFLGFQSDCLLPKFRSTHHRHMETDHHIVPQCLLFQLAWGVKLLFPSFELIFPVETEV